MNRDVRGSRNTDDPASECDRILARRMARQLTSKEVESVAGGLLGSNRISYVYSGGKAVPNDMV